MARNSYSYDDDDGKGEAGRAINASDLAALVDLAAAAQQVAVIEVPVVNPDEGMPVGTVPVLFDRKAQKPIPLNDVMEAYRTQPARREGTAQLQTLSAFTALIKRHMDDDSAIFLDLDWRNPSMTAVIDYHMAMTEAGGRPRNMAHRLKYAFPLSDPWKAWVEGNATVMGQDDFARFIEDHIAEIAAPNARETEELEAMFRTTIADPAEIMTLSRGLSVSVSAKSARKVSLASGEGQIVFEEVHKDGRGEQLTVPGLFMLALPVFVRSDPVRMPVRLRYRITEGVVRWSYEIWRPDEYVTEAVIRDRDAVVVATGLPVYEGRPEA